MATAVLPEIKSVPPRAVAPWRHTALLIAFFVLMAAGGAALQHRARGRADLVEHRPDVALLYVSLLAGEWGLVYYVWKGGLRRSGIGLLQVAVFGIAHGYQGVRSCLAIAIYGSLFTLLALWRKSLRPGMIAHAWTDIAGGLLGLG